MLAATAPLARAAPSAPPTSPSASTSAGAKPVDKKVATFGVGPASSTKVDGRPYFEYFAGPGAQTADHLAVVNLSTFPITLEVYATDAVNDATGAISYEAAPATATDSNTAIDASTWIRIATPHGSGQVTLPADTTIVLPIELAVPSNATPGDHTAGVAVALLTNVTGASTKKLTLEQRVVAKAFIRVSGPLHPGLAIQRLSARYHGTLNPIGQGSVKVHYIVKNTGNVNLSGQQRVSISGLFGASSTVSAIADVPLLLPGGSAPVTLTIAHAWPQFLVKGKASVTPLAEAGDVDPPLQHASASVSFWAVPWTMLAIIVVVVLVLGLLVWRRQRRPKPDGPDLPGQFVDVLQPVA